MVNKIFGCRGMIMVIPLGFCLAGCATTTTVKHLSSDVCLVMPESTTKTEVQSFLGEPAKKTTSPDGSEIWIYFKEDKDTLSKIPLLGKHIGTQNFETVIVTFIGNKVRTCIYRQLDPTEFSSFNRDHQIETPE